MPEVFKVSYKIERRLKSSEGQSRGVQIEATRIPVDFPYFNRALRAARKMVTADQNWDRIAIFIEREEVK